MAPSPRWRAGARRPCDSLRFLNGIVPDVGRPVTFPASAPPVTDETPSHAPVRPTDFSLETAEKELIIRALRETGWQRTRAAALLGITRATLHAKLKRYDISPPGGRVVPASESFLSSPDRRLQPACA
jgi:predicted DNA-binding protein (UPF0251 family)